MHDLTIVIVAYNAEQTIARAVQSAMKAGSYPILLIDDGSNDQTIEVARHAAGDQITICKQPSNQGVGAARARALLEIKTPYGMWLDSDDEIMPNRPADMLVALKGGADIVYDGGVLIDDASGVEVGKLEIPDFMFEKGAEKRCFERNWYPLLHCGFRTSFTAAVGFDRDFHCAEDYDFLLKAIILEAKIKSLPTIGYRYYHRVNTISRDLDRTKSHIRRSHEKYGVAAIEVLICESALSHEEGMCVLAGMALFKRDYNAALHYAQRVQDRSVYIAPYSMSAGQFSVFITASAYAAGQDWLKAHELLQVLVLNAPAADVWNNLGVALHHLGDVDKATLAFNKALKLMPGYYDAQKNIDAEVPIFWTSHPLRRQSSRNDYSS